MAALIRSCASQKAVARHAFRTGPSRWRENVAVCLIGQQEGRAEARGGARVRCALSEWPVSSENGAPSSPLTSPATFQQRMFSWDALKSVLPSRESTRAYTPSLCWPSRTPAVPERGEKDGFRFAAAGRSRPRAASLPIARVNQPSQQPETGSCAGNADEKRHSHTNACAPAQHSPAHRSHNARTQSIRLNRGQRRRNAAGAA